MIRLAHWRWEACLDGDLWPVSSWEQLQRPSPRPQEVHHAHTPPLHQTHEGLPLSATRLLRIQHISRRMGENPPKLTGLELIYMCVYIYIYMCVCVYMFQTWKDAETFVPKCLGQPKDIVHSSVAWKAFSSSTVLKVCLTMRFVRPVIRLPSSLLKTGVMPSISLRGDKKGPRNAPLGHLEPCFNQG